MRPNLPYGLVTYCRVYSELYCLTFYSVVILIYGAQSC